MTKLGAKKIQNIASARGGKKFAKSRLLKALEDEFQLGSLVDYQLDAQSIGAYFLQKPKKQAFKIVFGFDCLGIHPSLGEEQLEAALDALENGLKELPREETLTIQLSSFINDFERQQDLSALIQGTSSQEIKFLLMGEAVRVRELTRRGLRKQKSLKLFATYTICENEDKDADIWEKILKQVESSWAFVSGSKQEYRLQSLDLILRNAYTDGFQFWQQFFRNKLQLSVTPFSVDALWDLLWSKFNFSRPKLVPQKIKITSNEIEEIINSTVHPLSLLLEEESSIPIADRQWIRVKNKFISVLSFADKPAGWKDKKEQLRYLWQVFAQERIFDTECIVQIRGANPNLLKARLSSLTKQANLQAQYSAERNNVDVAANLKMDAAIAAQASLYSGEQPLDTAIIFLLYRNDLERLAEDSKYLSSLFFRPAWVVRETEYAWKIWAQSFPLTFDKLMATPFNRRCHYLTSEIPGLLPLCKTRQYDSRGFELMAQEGGTPIFLDLYSKHRNLGVFATTRGGKSVLVSGILLQALAHGLPISAIDFPKPDGTGTFSDLSAFLGDYSSYFDIGKEANNLFEPPNLRGLPAQIQQERFADYQEFLVEVLLTMVVGLVVRPDLNPDSIRSIIVLATAKFFVDPGIRQRYAAAFSAGFGSQAWQRIPTLEDFIPYCSLERLQLVSPSADLVKALEFCKLRLRFWLESKVGKAISRPTSFRADAQFLIVALRNLSSDEDAAILGLSVYMAALRRSLASPASIFFIDEAPILFQYESLASLVASLCANGAKSGIRVILSAQEPESIAQSKFAPKIFANLTTRLVGRIQPTAIEPFVRHFQYPRELIAVNATEAYYPQKAELSSQWLLDDLGYFTPCKYHPSQLLLATVANNPEEVRLRSKFLRQYPNKFQAYAKFKDAYLQMLLNS